MISLKKNLAIIVLGLSGCVSQPVCPSDLEKIKAGYYFMTAARMAESDKTEDLKVAKKYMILAFLFIFQAVNQNHVILKNIIVNLWNVLLKILNLKKKKKIRQ